MDGQAALRALVDRGLVNWAGGTHGHRVGGESGIVRVASASSPRTVGGDDACAGQNRLGSERVGGWSGPLDPGCCPSGWASVDGQLPGGGLAWGATHEWFSALTADSTSRHWLAPLSLLTHLAAQALRLRDAGLHGHPTGRSLLVFVGRGCWPSLWLLRQTLGPQACSRVLLVDAPAGPPRLWAIDQALRSSAVAAVVADASALDMASSRRLQLAAETGRSLGLLTRPWWERRAISAAATRWMVRPWPGDSPTLSLELLRCKSSHGGVGWAAFRRHAALIRWTLPGTVEGLRWSRAGPSPLSVVDLETSETVSAAMVDAAEVDRATHREHLLSDVERGPASAAGHGSGPALRRSLA